jgi:hypothetical protein
VLIVLFDGVQSLDVTGPLEVFAGAREAVGPAAYEITTASVGGAPVRTGSGLVIRPDRDLLESGTPHTVIVPGGPGIRRPAHAGGHAAGVPADPAGLAGRVPPSFLTSSPWSPTPPYAAGSPRTAPAELTARLRAASRYPQPASAAG